MNNQKECSDYLPIEDYGITGDLNTVALVSMQGSIDFMCFPNFDSPTIFSALLDKDKGGNFQIRPQSNHIRYKQLYLPDTNVLLTRFLSKDGIAELTDFMPVQPVNGGSELIRRVMTIQGKFSYKLNCSPRFNYGRSEHRIRQLNEKEWMFYCDDLGMELRIKGTVALHADDDSIYVQFSLGAGESAEFIFSDSRKNSPENSSIKEFIDKSLQQNIRFWRQWMNKCQYKGRWREVVYRSALTLKMMIAHQYGSFVAAPTFGLPEEIGGERNWDYRYTWLRDTSFSVYSMLKLGYKQEAAAFISWVENKCFPLNGQKNLQTVYRLNGNIELPEEILDSMDGYCSSRPVRIGNAAYKQLQLDIYGELMDAVYQFDKHGEAISYRLWENLSKQLEWLSKNWNRKDEGIWEIRGGEKEFLYSKLMCWLAFDRAVKIAVNRSYPYPDSWINIRNELFTSIHKDYFNEELNSFVQYKGAETVDASALLMPIVGFISPRDPKWLSTMKCIEERLVVDFLVYRYHNNQSLEGLHGNQGTFSMCTFWYVECLCLAGELYNAQLYFEKMLGYANHLGLFAEQLGFSGQHLGNYPQAFTHLGLINTALCLNERLNNVQKD